MVAYTPLDLDNQIMLYDKKLNLNLDGKKISECIDIILDSCPKLHSNKELYNLAVENLKKIESKFGFDGLRVWYHSNSKQLLLQSFTGRDELQLKYDKLIDEVKEYHKTLFDFELQFDYYIYLRKLEEAYSEVYGEIKDFNNQIYSIIKTIHITGYNKEVINSLHRYLDSSLRFSGDKYYLEKDLYDKDNLHSLYKHMAEVNYDSDVYIGMDIFSEYDGYGGIRFS